jgi:uncharacterized protein (DUF433 family)
MRAKHSPVHRDPDLLGGTPVFVGSRVPASSLLDDQEAGETFNEFYEDGPGVTREQDTAAPGSSELR